MSKKKKVQPVRYIVRTYRISSNIRKEPLDKGRSTFSRRKDVGAKVHVADRDRNRFYSAAKIVTSIGEARKFINRMRKEFKQTKTATNFNFNVQPFKGKVSTSRIRVYLKRGSESVAAAHSKNTKKTTTDFRFGEERERVFRSALAKVEDGDFYPVERSYGRRRKQRKSGLNRFGKPK